MNYRTIFLALVAGWFSSPMATAQQSPLTIPNQQGPLTIPNNTLFDVRFVESGMVLRLDSKIMWEDVEIFRRILDRSLQGWVGKAQGGELGLSQTTWDGLWQSSTNQQYFVGTRYPDSGRSQGVSHPFATEGNYLRGYGVVLTAILPWDEQNPIVEPSQPEPRSLSEWDRVRKEIRGETIEPKPSTTRRGSSLATVVLKVLAENGRHFAQLSENDRVAVAITLRPTPSLVAPQVGMRLDSLNMVPALPSGTLAPIMIFDGTKTPISVHVEDVRVQQAKQQALDAAESQKVEAANFVHLGEQRQKQGRYSEAAEAYQKAIAAYQKLLELKKQPGHSVRDLLVEVAAVGDVRSRLAQVYFDQGKNDAAVQLLEQISKDYGAFTQKSAPKAKAAPAKEPVFAKLIISAPKKVLDQVGAGKLSLDEFKKQITLDYWGFPAKGPSQPTGERRPSSAPAEKTP